MFSKHTFYVFNFSIKRMFLFRHYSRTFSDFVGIIQREGGVMYKLNYRFFTNFVRFVVLTYKMINVTFFFTLSTKIR